jgi:hypothetical protein
LEKAKKWVQTSLEKAKEVMKRRFNMKRQPFLELGKGDRVWVNAQQLPTSQETSKLDDKWHGPFTIEEKVGAQAYQ